MFKEFDPGSGRTLAARLTHASRTDGGDRFLRNDVARVSGGWVSNAWGTYLLEGNNSWKRLLIPHNVAWSHDRAKKDGLY